MTLVYTVTPSRVIHARNCTYMCPLALLLRRLIVNAGEYMYSVRVLLWFRLYMHTLTALSVYRAYARLEGV